MPLMPDTIAAVATGAQVAAIGIVRLSGDDAHRIADALFRLLNEILHRFGHFGFRQGVLLFGLFFLFARNPYKGEA